eukprot:SAG31_NODE_17210_length_672_cov_0.943103_2_plen_96_part_01
MQETLLANPYLLLRKSVLGGQRISFVTARVGSIQAMLGVEIAPTSNLPARCAENMAAVATVMASQKEAELLMAGLQDDVRYLNISQDISNHLRISQ